MYIYICICIYIYIHTHTHTHKFMSLTSSLVRVCHYSEPKTVNPKPQTTHDRQVVRKRHYPKF